MQNTDYFKDKKVVVVGLARSGVASVDLLQRLGAKVSVSDNGDTPAIRQKAKGLSLKNIAVELGRHSPDFIQGQELMVVSPGVPGDSLALTLAKQAGIPILSEIELAWRLCLGEVIAITGTNGKTTVTTLIAKAIEASGRKAFLCGNIGNPFSAQVPEIMAQDLVCLEVSSFQLEYIHSFRPKVAVILNLSRNHLDRYQDMSDYLKAKKRIFLNQDRRDFLVLNADDPWLYPLNKQARAQTVYFSKGKELNPNQAAVLAVADILGIAKNVVLEVFREFKGVEHRLEEVLQIRGVSFINDSKATSVDATIWALNNISRPIILIAGGREKGNDYALIGELARQKIKEIVVIGEAQDKIREYFSPYLPVSTAQSLKQALGLAFSKAVSGDCVLLSPMCKSFDMFSDYEERGEVFKKAVLNLENKKINHDAKL